MSLDEFGILCQQNRREEKQRHMHPCLRQRFAADEKVRVTVSREKHHLKKQHARGPHSGTATKPWQDEFAGHGLDLEQQESTQQANKKKHAS